jgi:hypothetical protein
MSIDTTRPAGGAHGGRQSRRLTLAGVAAGMLALTLASPAWAGTSATATLAPIGSGSYLLTVTNTGSETITGFIASAGEEPAPSNIVPSAGCHYGNTPVTASISCTLTIAPGASAQMCYSGKALVEELPGSALILLPQAGPVSLTSAAAVTACPVPGFTAASSTGPASSGAAKCLVPALKGKTLAAAEKAITKAHCAVGKVKKVRSSHVKKGSVVSQGTAAGKSLPGGTKVGLEVSKGR